MSRASGVTLHRVAPTRIGVLALLTFLSGCVGSGSVGEGPGLAGESEYRVYIANESSDVVSRVVFDRVAGARVEREIRVGIMPADTDGPHGVTLSPDGEFVYVTLAHGTPDGWLWKFGAGPDTLVGRTDLGRFPATLSTAADGQLLIVANFNLHGDPEPSSLSIVYAPDLTELARVTTCVTPHGSRVNAAGTFHYSACMRSDQVVELSLSSFGISRRFSVRPGEEGPLPIDDIGIAPGTGPGDPTCSPTWVTPGGGERSGQFVYVTCNAAGEVLELDVAEWRVARRFEMEGGPYNMALTPNGRRLVVTLRGDQRVSVIDLQEGRELARVSTSQPFTHGVVISPDGRYAFVTNESIGSVRGTMDVIDLASFERAATVQLQHQPGGIGFWRQDPVGEGPAP